MTEKTNQKYTRPLRAALIAAAAVAMMVVSAAAANPEGFQQFVFEIMSAVQVDDYRMDLTSTGGEQVTVFSIPQAELQEREGRTVLVLDGEDEADITDALRETGKYTYEKRSGDSCLTAEVEGTPDRWTIVLKVGQPGEERLAYTFTRDETGHVTARGDIPGGDGESYTWTSVSAEEGESLSLDEILVK